MELREKIARAMAEGRMIKWEHRGEATKNWFLDKADQILDLIKQAGYVKLSNDQSCKIQRAGSGEIEDTTFPEIYDDVRRVEL